MNVRLALVLLVAGFVAATSPVWAVDAGNPTFSSTSATPGQTVSFLGTGSGGPFARDTCEVTGPDGEPLTNACSFDEKGLFSGWVAIPVTVTPGASYLLSFCGAGGCTDAKAPWTAANSLDIATPPAWGQVPSGLHCLTYHEALVLLQGRGLRILKTGFPWRIGHVSPAPGTQLVAGATVTPYPLLVPSLATGLPYPDAASRVRAACATPILVGPANGVVVGQAPSALTTMPSQLLVTVFVTPTSSSSPTGSTATASSSASSLVSGSSSPPRSGQTGCCDHGGHHRRRVLLRVGAGSVASAFAVAGGLVFVRRRHLLHLQPVVDAAAVVVSVSEVRPSRQVTEGRRGRIAASVLAVTRRSRIEIEEQP